MIITSSKTNKEYLLEIVSSIPLSRRYGVREIKVNDADFEYECFECIGLASCNITDISGVVVAKGVNVYLFTDSATNEIVPELVNGGSVWFSSEKKIEDALDGLCNFIEIVEPELPLEEIRRNYIRNKERKEEYIHFTNKQ